MKRNRHDEVLIAAARVIRESGYHAASMEAIARRAGLLKGSLYHYTPGKEALLREILARGLSQYHAWIDGVLARDGPVAHKLKAAFCRHIEAYDALSEFHPVFVKELGRLPAPVRRRIVTEAKAYEAKLLALIKAGMASGAVRRNLDPKLILLALLGMGNWMHIWYRRGGRLTSREIAEEFWKVLWEGIGAPKQGRAGRDRTAG